jgi:hypothetical protein
MDVDVESTFRIPPGVPGGSWNTANNPKSFTSDSSWDTEATSNTRSVFPSIPRSWDATHDPFETLDFLNQHAKKR